MKIYSTLFNLTALVFLLIGCTTSENTDSVNIVKDIAAFNQAVENAKPGDKIVLANGVWENTELIFKGKGTVEAPITLTVQEKGKVTLEGQSNLSISGEYLHVEGLVFKNGYTDTKEVISLRTSKKDLCNNCRVTECVIDNYNNPERFETDYWVSIYGKNNRFDHNHLTGKRNHGVTLAVRLNTEESRENNHRIDHNYFGHRPILGANGGETFRVGTSHYSLTNSNTITEFNYFDRCNGEHEIISSKSCQNIYRNNTFYECQGTLTMRHGNETLVEDNYFFGNGKANTGGIRIINESQTVINNYMEGLTGYRFRGALVIMNGVPNSPPNRYFQVKDSKATNNTFINCDHIQLCAGSDEERSAAPINTVVSDNLFYNDNKDKLFTVYDDISGIDFSNNITGENIESINKTGFTKQKLEFKRNELGILESISELPFKAGIQPKGERATLENTGVSWYPRNEEEVRFNTGKKVAVKAGTNTLLEAIKNSNTGDILELEAGNYIVTKSVDVTHPLTIVGTGDKPNIQFQRTSLFNIENGGSLSLENLMIDGSEAPDAHGNTVIRTSRYSMNRNYKLFIENCDFKKLDINHTFDILRIYQNTFADSIVLRNSTFSTVDGNVLALNKERDDIGIYNVENVLIENCTFTDISGVVLDLYRGGRDESTFGPMLLLKGSRFNNVGKGKRNKAKASLSLHGVQFAQVEDSEFNDSEPVKLHLVVGEPITELRNLKFNNTEKISSNSDAYLIENVTYK